MVVCPSATASMSASTFFGLLQPCAHLSPSLPLSFFISPLYILYLPFSPISHSYLSLLSPLLSPSPLSLSLSLSFILSPCFAPSLPLSLCLSPLSPISLPLYHSLSLSPHLSPSFASPSLLISLPSLFSLSPLSQGGFILLRP